MGSASSRRARRLARLTMVQAAAGVSRRGAATGCRAAVSGSSATRTANPIARSQ